MDVSTMDRLKQILNCATNKLNVKYQLLNINGMILGEIVLDNSDIENETYSKLNNLPEVASLWNNKHILSFNSNRTINGLSSVHNFLLNTKAYGVENTISKIDLAVNHKYTYYYLNSINGFKIDKEVYIDENIKLVPIELLPFSFIEDLRVRFGYGRFSAPTFSEPVQNTMLVYSGKSEISSNIEDPEQAIANTSAIIDKMRCICSILPIFTNAACFPVHYFEYLEKDFIFNTSEGGAATDNEINISGMNIKKVVIDGKGIKDAINKFLRLSSDLQTKLYFTLRRYNYAIARIYVHDKAIELRTVIETLLADDRGSDPLSHLVSQRGAWLLGDSPSQRIEYSKMIKDAYNIGSKAVHGDFKYLQKHEIENQNIINRFCNLCSQLILKIIDIGYIPDKGQWDKLTMGEKL